MLNACLQKFCCVSLKGIILSDIMLCVIKVSVITLNVIVPLFIIILFIMSRRLMHYFGSGLNRRQNAFVAMPDIRYVTVP